MKPTSSSLSPETVSTRAYQLWEIAGRPEGRDQEFWFRAVEELKGRNAARSSPLGERNGATLSRRARERRVAHGTEQS
jgi:hypothetical protein